MENNISTETQRYEKLIHMPSLEHIHARRDTSKNKKTKEKRKEENDTSMC